VWIVCIVINSYNTMQYNTIQYNTIQCYCGDNETSVALIGQCNQIEKHNTIQYNVIGSSVDCLYSN